MSDSFLIDEEHAEIFAGPKIVTVSEFAVVRLAPGQHTITLTAERLVLLTITPEADPA